MNFAEAMIVVMDGGKVARADWDDGEANVALVERQLRIRKKGEKYRPWLITSEDLEAVDWEVFVVDA